MPETKEEIDLAEVINQQAAKIAELESEVYTLKLKHSKGLSYGSDNAPYTALYWRNIYLEGKLRRQTAAITKIQKVGWQPSRIIKEVPYPDEDWPVTQHESHRRDKRRPSILIGEV